MMFLEKFNVENLCSRNFHFDEEKMNEKWGLREKECETEKA